MQKVTADTFGTGPFEDLAQRAVRDLSAEFSASLVLTRMYVTVPFAEFQMPKQFARDGICFDLDYRKVQAPEQPARLLVIVRDVTSQVAAEKAAARARERHGVVHNILRDQRGFDRFVEDTSSLLSRIQAATDEVQQGRDLHTIKGNTAVVGFVTLPAVVHRLESEQIEGRRLLLDDEIEVLRHAWSDALSMVADFVRRGEARVG